jgi:hypothetical protein
MREKRCWLAENKRLKAQANKLFGYKSRDESFKPN